MYCDELETYKIMMMIAMAAHKVKLSSHLWCPGAAVAAWFTGGLLGSGGPGSGTGRGPPGVGTSRRPPLGTGLLPPPLAAGSLLPKVLFCGTALRIHKCYTTKEETTMSVCMSK